MNRSLVTVAGGALIAMTTPHPVPGATNRTEPAPVPATFEHRVIDDADENPYDFAIQGTGTSTAPIIYDANTLTVVTSSGDTRTTVTLAGATGGDFVRYVRLAAARRRQRSAPACQPGNGRGKHAGRFG